MNEHTRRVHELEKLVVDLGAQVSRVRDLINHARKVSPSERQTVYVADVQAALDGDQSHVGPRKRGQNDTTDPEGPA